MPRCEHLDFRVEADVGRLTRSETDETVVGYTMDVRVKCNECFEPFEFIGLPMGVLPSEPTCNLDGTEARMPIRPQNAAPTFGLDLPGFTVRERPVVAQEER